MSIKKYFEVAQNIKSLSQKSADEIGTKVESVAYHEQDIIAEERFIPRVNYSDPASFARYGYAADYYAQSIKRIYSTYPYDGSLKERLEWENDSTYLDLFIYNEEYPRTNGYVILSADGWGAVSSTADGYGLPATAEYIYFKGGPNTNPNGMSPYSLQFTGSNYYEPSKNRASNLQLDVATRGASVEFWLQKDKFVTASTEKEVIFDMWNGETSSSADYGRLRVELSGTADGLNPFLVTLYSGSEGFFQQSLGASTVTTASIADGQWHHYAVTVQSASAGVLTRFYVDGQLNNEQTLGSVGLNNIKSVDMRANLGALVAAPSGSSAVANAGKLSGSLDEFRYWKAQRSSEQIGLYWFTQVGGGVNSDPTPFIETSEVANIDLGVYFKFNEGITGVTATDSVVLDFSGRVSNGAWEGYTANSRNTGSAIVISKAATSEFKDPIIYSFHPAVEALTSRLETSGSAHDVSNNAAIYKSIPSWITEEDDEGTGELKKLTQIISSYFDTLHLQIESLSTLKNVEYVSGSNKPLPFAEKLLGSHGMVAPELFIDADILEKLNDRSEDLVYEKSLEDIKNTIYQNIYNNLSYIYKSKGTLKAFRNLIRCFGIDEELVRVNMYADNVEYKMRDNRTEVVRADRFVNFNTAKNKTAVVYNYPDSTNSSSVGFITASSPLANGYAYTMETEVILPLKPQQSDATYFDTNAISSSVFGIHGAVNDGTDTTWAAADEVNFQVLTVRDELNSNNARFVLTGTAGGYVPELTSELFEDVYNNTRWNLAVRVKPENYPLSSFVDGADTGNYVIELCGHRAEAGVILESFVVSGTVDTPPAGFITGSRRAFIGAHRTNFTGSLLETSDVKVNACRYWLDYLETDTLKAHVLDTENNGNFQPHLYAYPFDTTASFGDITKFDTLVFNWEFLTNTGSNGSGQFIVDDLSSGSVDLTRFGDLGNILNKQYTAQGDLFGASTAAPIDKDYVVSSKLNLPEHIYSEDMINVLDTADQDVFMPDTRPIHYYFAFEKSMYQTISVEILNYFANLKDFNNLIGDAINQWRPEYKSLKFMRQKFFEKVGNDQLDFDKFYEFYKWFDTSLSVMLAQLVPASADFSDNVLTVIENHILERPKYQRKFPFIEKVGGTDIGSTAVGGGGGGPNEPPPIIGTLTDKSPKRPDRIRGSGAPTRRQIGSSNVVPAKSWNEVHAPQNGSDKEKLYWHRYLKEESEDRKGIREAIKQTYNRRIGSVVNLGADAAVVMGGVATHPNTRPGYTFAATAPWGPTVPSTNIPINVMVSFDSDVEELVDTTDVFHPSAKQRLGFGMDPSINIDGSRKGDGNIFAPFSLYSSSVTTGYNSRVQTRYKAGTAVTNLHHDFVGETDVPMQGPFTEKYVGGRQYRHTTLNDGTDTRENRAEGFRLELGLLTSGSTRSGSLGVGPPNYPFGNSPSGSAPEGFLPNIPIAPRLRDEAAKRPVNIRNIQMRTGSTILGNYEKNYQVVSTAGRTQNDLFFREQTFDFSLYPETLATRGRFPLSPELPTVSDQHKSLLFDGTDDYVEIGDITYWAGAVTGSNVSVSFWMNPSSIANLDTIFCLGHIGQPFVGDYRAGLQLKFYFSAGDGGDVLYAEMMDTSGLTSYVYNDLTAISGIQTGTWYHVVVTYGSGAPSIYLNGALQSVASSDNLATFTGPEDYPLTLGDRLGFGGGKYDGYMADFVVWDNILTAGDVTTLYNGGTYIDISTLSLSGAPYGWWPLGDDENDDPQGTLQNNITTDPYGNPSPDGTPYNFAANAIKEVTPFPTTTTYESTATPNPGGNRDYEIPQRTGSASNQTVIVNRFAGCGYEVMSLGYMDPAHEELSVYNALPYRDLSVIDFGFPGSASLDPSIQHTIRVVDQIQKNRGLDQRATLHCGPFGSDAAYGSVPELTYVTVPSWNKTNRNARRRMVLSGTSESTYIMDTVYDNLFVQHAIPRSTQQYSWVTASLENGQTIFGLQPPLCTSASALTQLITKAPAFAADFTPLSTDVSFVGINELIYEPLSASSHTLGYPLATSIDGYINSDLATSGLGNATNALQLYRNGPYGYPTWKQIRTGEHKIARELRQTNMIGTVRTPQAIPNLIRGRKIGYINPSQPNTFVDYFEPPIMSQYSPVTFYFEDPAGGASTANDLMMSAPFGNELDWFNHEGLNNRLGLTIDLDKASAYGEIVKYITTGPGQSLSVIANHSQRVYPAAVNVYNDIVRSRTEFTIDNIWNKSRAQRSELGGKPNSQAQTVASSSIWPLDGHLNFTITSSVTASDGAGELMNSYSRFAQQGQLLNSLKPAATYAQRVPVGTTGSTYAVFAGDAKWQAAEQAGKNPYVDYVDYAHRMRLVGKDMSIVPEFRISSHIDTYVNEKEGDFLANIDGILELTGAAIENSSKAKFFQTYTNADFMKYFMAVDEDLHNKRSTGSQLQRDKISLKCDALVKFLPYKGFYPAERTLELATLFSQSYGPSATVYTGSGGAQREQAFRTLLEPMASPGILYNTIKSGIAVDYRVLVNTASLPTSFPNTRSVGAATTFPEGVVQFPNAGIQVPKVLAGSGIDAAYGFFPQRLPFEALYKPSVYFSDAYLAGELNDSGRVYDTGIQTGSVESVIKTDSAHGTHPVYAKLNEGGKLYEFAMDNFLCETTEFFLDGLQSFVSQREDEFQPVVNGTEYQMRLRLYRTLNDSAHPTADRSSFDMYGRETAFGFPLARSIAATSPGTPAQSSFAHLTPPYWSGSAEAVFVYTAQTTGIPTLDEILSNTVVTYNRIVGPQDAATTEYHMNANACFNLTDFINSVPDGTVTQQKNWLIQTKFETPILNFANVAYETPPTSSVTSGLTSADNIKINGMWHQYGQLPADSSEGVFAVIDDGEGTVSTTDFGAPTSLADIVGFKAGIPSRIGSLKQSNILEEAVVAVPFKTVKNRRVFFTEVSIPQRGKLKDLMNKYVFPPRFDFTRHDTVDPILMYAFEFSAKLSQQDIADMWQNLPPSIAESFEQKEVVIEEKEVLNLLAENSEEIQWMVFKVKKRAKKSFEKYRRSLVSEDTSAFPDTIGEYSYNWPYDYFSLVELINIDEGVQYKSGDVTRRTRQGPSRGEAVVEIEAETTTTPRDRSASTTGPRRGEAVEISTPTTRTTRTRRTRGGS